ncbi:unnamed protein product [Cyclocybe aegerita]|uniref:Uncharacterized protein n=1 Tax=Cyclocybe aegerita TaxID=1973307 RepID=A0A8S0Y172_CYCAE|nr:unnamed protein product [Cyclocybe aegerita]
MFQPFQSIACLADQPQIVIKRHRKSTRRMPISITSSTLMRRGRERMRLMTMVVMVHRPTRRPAAVHTPPPPVPTLGERADGRPGQGTPPPAVLRVADVALKLVPAPLLPAPYGWCPCPPPLPLRSHNRFNVPMIPTSTSPGSPWPAPAHTPARACVPPPSTPRGTLGGQRKGKAKAVDIDGDVEMTDGQSQRKKNGSVDGQAIGLLQPGISSAPSRRSAYKDPKHHSSELRPPDPGLQPSNDSNDGRSTSLAPDFDVEPPPATEDRMPPKMRKNWMHREVEAMKGMGSPGSADSPGEGGHANGFGNDKVDEHKLMPPPPMPASLDPTTISSTDVAGVPSPQPRYLTSSQCKFKPLTTNTRIFSFHTHLYTHTHLSTAFNLFSGPIFAFSTNTQQQQGGGSPSFPFPPLSRKVEEGEKEEIFKPKIWGPLKAGLPTSSSAPPLRPSSPVSSALKMSSSAKDVVRQPSPSTLAQTPHHEEEEDVKMVDGTSPRSPTSTKVPLRPKSPSQDPDSVAYLCPASSSKPTTVFPADGSVLPLSLNRFPLDGCSVANRAQGTAQ